MTLRIGAKISLGFMLVLALVIIVGGNSIISLKHAKEDLTNIKEANERLILEMQIDNTFKDGVAAMRGFIAYGDEKYFKLTEESMKKTLEMENSLLQIAREDKKPEVQKLIDVTTNYTDGIINKLSPAVRSYHSQLQAGNSAQAKKDFEEMNNIARELIPLTEELTRSLQELVKSNHEIVNQNLDQSLQNADSTINTALVMTIICIIIGILLSIFLTRMIRNPIIKIVGGAARYADGDFREQIQVKSSDEIGDLARALNAMQGSFKDIIEKLNLSAGQLAGSAQQLASQAQQTSAGA